MATEEEVRQENESLLEQQQRLFQQQESLREELQKQIDLLKQQVHTLQGQLNKDSHNSHPPPSSDRFHRQPKSLRKQSGKKPGGQSGHVGSTLRTPRRMILEKGGQFNWTKTSGQKICRRRWQHM